MKERGKIEKLWREEKYRVLLHDQNAYNKIRALLKESPLLRKYNFKLMKQLIILQQLAQLLMPMNTCGVILKI